MGRFKQIQSFFLLFITIAVGVWLISFFNENSPIQQNIPPNIEQEIQKPIENINTVSEIVDGDTIKINHNGEIKTIRIAGIDTPETRGPNKGIECYGEESTARLNELLPIGSQITLEDDSLQDETDRYGRLLKFVKNSENKDVGKVLLQEGFAKVYLGEEGDREDYYLGIESEAKEKKIGMWEECDYIDISQKDSN